MARASGGGRAVIPDLEWTDWMNPGVNAANSPYVDWWTRRPHAVRGKGGVVLNVDPSRTLSVEEEAAIGLRVVPPYEAFVAQFRPRAAPIRKDANNAPFWDRLKAETKSPEGVPPTFWDPTGLASDDVPYLPPDAVILAVIDRGVPLHHHRLREAGGGTRILAAWQQDARHDRGQPYLPMGRELYKFQIDAALQAAFEGGEDELNAALGLVEMQGAPAPRELARRQAHGAAVLDLAAGYDPARSEGSTAERVFAIVVNLPDRQTIGLSGAFLDYFTSLALYRVDTLARWLWRENLPRWAEQGLAPATGQEGFPIVANLSFGKNAGPEHGNGFFHQVHDGLRRDRPAGGPLHLVMPAGNDNLEQGNGQLVLAAGCPMRSVGLWIPPEDQSQNFVEIWSDPIPVSDAEKAHEQIVLQIRPPFASVPFLPVEPVIDKVRYLVDKTVVPQEDALRAPFAALYLRQFEEPGRPGHVRLQYTLCTLPTLDQEAPRDTVPPGLWEIAVENRSGRTVTLTVSVQTDQSVLPDGSEGRRARLIDPTYRRVDDMGRYIDSYSYPFSRPPANIDDAEFVRRHGTLNASASAPGVLVAAGFRVIDGRPADYSATGALDGLPWQWPDAAFPVEAGAAHPGVLAASSRDGIVAPVSGTSFASAIAARHVAEALARHVVTAASAADIDRFDPAASLGMTSRTWGSADPDEIPAPKVGRGAVGFAEADRQADRYWLAGP